MEVVVVDMADSLVGYGCGEEIVVAFGDTLYVYACKLDHQGRYSFHRGFLVENSLTMSIKMWPLISNGKIRDMKILPIDTDCIFTLLDMSHRKR